MYIFRLIHLVFLFCMLHSALIGQQVISVENYLKSKLNQLDTINQPLFAGDYAPSPIEVIEFRTETNDFQLNEQQFVFRVRPNTRKIRSAQKDLFLSYKEISSFELEELEKEFIEIVYEDVLNLYESIQRKKIEEQLLSILKDQEVVLAKLSQTAQKDPKEWLEVQEEILQLELKIYRDKTIVERKQSSAVQVDWSTLAPVSSLPAIMAKINLSSPFLFTAKERQFEQEILEQEIEMEKAEQKNFLDFFQVEYRGPAADPLKERVSLTAAFQLQTGGNRLLKLEELAIEKDFLEKKNQKNLQLNQLKKEKQEGKIQQLIAEWEMSKQLISEHQEKVETIARRNTRDLAPNPLFLLYSKENTLKKELDLFKLEMDIYQEYLDYLILTEQLYQRPFDKLSTL